MEDQHGPQATIRRNFRGAKILLIDDNPDERALISRVLKDCLPEVDLWMASTATEALSQLQQWVDTQQALPRLILLDIYLPHPEQGWNVLHQLKATDSVYRLIPVTLLTHSQKPEDIQMGYDLGANSYIIKPTDYPQWLTYFQTLRQYWWLSVTLPPR